MTIQRLPSEVLREVLTYVPPSENVASVSANWKKNAREVAAEALRQSSTLEAAVDGWPLFKSPSQYATDILASAAKVTDRAANIPAGALALRCARQDHPSTHVAIAAARALFDFGAAGLLAILPFFEGGTEFINSLSEAQMSNRQKTVEMRKWLSGRNPRLDTLDISGWRRPAHLHFSFASLGDRGLALLPEELGTCQVRVLKAADHQLTSIPPTFWRSPLWTLDMSRNCFEEVPPILSRMRNLSVLILSYQRGEKPLDLGEHSSLWNLTSLHTLHLDGNRMERMSSWIARLEGLVSLNLSSNGLSDLPREIASLQNLRSLQLNDNPLQQIPLCLYNSSLTLLSLRDTQIPFPDIVHFLLHIAKHGRFFQLEINLLSPREKADIKQTIESQTSMQVTGDDDHDIGSWVRLDPKPKEAEPMEAQEPEPHGEHRPHEEEPHPVLRRTRARFG